MHALSHLRYMGFTSTERRKSVVFAYDAKRQTSFDPSCLWCSWLGNYYTNAHKPSASTFDVFKPMENYWHKPGRCPCEDRLVLQVVALTEPHYFAAQAPCPKCQSFPTNRPVQNPSTHLLKPGKWKAIDTHAQVGYCCR
jgi:hypothetical protein